MRSKLFLVLSAVFVFMTAIHAQDSEKPKSNVELSWNNVHLNGPIRDADIKVIHSLENWETAGAYIDDDCKDQMAAVASLAKIPGLKKLTVSAPKSVTNLNFLKDLPNLEDLHIRFTNEKVVFDCRNIAKLRKLREFSVDEVKLKNAASLKACSKLKRLGFKGADIDSLAFVEGTPLLESLSLNGRGHTFDSYAPLAKLTKLTDLSIYINKQATDENVKVIGSLRRLEKLNMGFCSKLTTLDFLKPCRRLKVLEAGGAYDLKDISALAGMANLEEVSLTSTRIEDIAALGGKKKLKELCLTGCKKVTDLGPLATCPGLEELWIGSTAIKSISPLAKCRNLHELLMHSTQVSSLKPLRNCKNLERVDVPKTVSERHVQAIKKTFPKCNVILEK